LRESTSLAILLLFALASSPAQAGEWCGTRANDLKGILSQGIPDRWYCSGRTAAFYVACRGHDECYWTLGAKKEDCDDDFKKRLHKECEESFPGGVWFPCQGYCKSAANGYAEAVHKTGGDSYKAGQSEAAAVLEELKRRCISDSEVIRKKIAEYCSTNTNSDGVCNISRVAQLINREFSSPSYKPPCDLNTNECLDGQCVPKCDATKCEEHKRETVELLGGQKYEYVVCASSCGPDEDCLSGRCQMKCNPNKCEEEWIDYNPWTGVRERFCSSICGEGELCVGHVQEEM